MASKGKAATTANKKMTYLIATPPYDKIGAYTGARIALTSAMDGHKVSVVLMEDGVYCALKGMETTQFFKTVQILQDFKGAGGTILVCGLCLKERGIATTSLIDGCEVVDIHRVVSEMTSGDQSVFFA
jgi:sulfur relay (sulfurtransferase) complex TusBCD TusD component (DsrE family)